MYYNIVEVGNESIILASCNNLQFAKNYLEDIKKADLYLKSFYNWNKLPKYKIIKRGVKND